MPRRRSDPPTSAPGRNGRMTKQLKGDGAVAVSRASNGQLTPNQVRTLRALASLSNGQAIDRTDLTDLVGYAKNKYPGNWLTDLLGLQDRRLVAITDEDGLTVFKGSRVKTYHAITAMGRFLLESCEKAARKVSEATASKEVVKAKRKVCRAARKAVAIQTTPARKIVPSIPSPISFRLDNLE